MKTFVLLGGGTEAVPMIRRVRELGFRAVIVDGNPKAPGFIPGIIPLRASCYHAEQAIPALRELNIPLDGVMCAAVAAR